MTTSANRQATDSKIGRSQGARRLLPRLVEKTHRG